VFATITGVSRALLAELGDPEGASNIGALIPFFMMVLMAKGFIVATPFIVRAVSGNIMMPALTAGFGGSYAFARGLTGSQQVYNRYAIGGATGAEYAALRARQFLGLQSLPARPNSAGGTNPPRANSSTDTGARMMQQLARLNRLGRR
jgi:type IV secretion system protein VirB6